MITVTSHPVFQLIQNEDFKHKLKENLQFVRESLDFSLQKRKMTETFGWHPDIVLDMENLYIKFLALHKTLWSFNLSFTIIPNRLIDEFWHAHILDTEKYMEDCNKIFGKYFHHFPYYGMIDEEDRKNWLSHAEVCQHVWEESFDEKLYAEFEDDTDRYSFDKEFYGKLSQLYKEKRSTWEMGYARCRTTCKPMDCPR